jgi:hypothetical protein
MGIEALVRVEPIKSKGWGWKKEGCKKVSGEILFNQDWKFIEALANW